MDLNIRIAGQAGQGVQSAGQLLAGVLGSLGLHVLSTKSYMSRIRGGLNWFDIRIGDRELFAGKDKANLLVALSRSALEILAQEVEEGGVILFDGQNAEGAIAINFTKAATQAAGAKIMANTVAAGSVFGVLGYDVERLCDYLKAQFSNKGEEVIQKNLACARRGAELATERGVKLTSPPPSEAARNLLSGAEAIGLSACQAGVKFATAYPMTPATATFNYFAANADAYGVVVEQAEDELAAVNMVCGATYAGAIAMTMTSGGGFALMTEGLSLAGMMELPVVVLLGQRPGPATGLPTRTAQQDLKFVLCAGHGEFPRAIYAPGTVEQCYRLTRKALQTAHKYQTPVIILTDQFLQDMETNIDLPGDGLDPICRSVLDDAAADYQRYEVTESGVSPRAVPGGEAFVVCDSDEHKADGHITEDLDAHLAQQRKRMRKLQPMAAEALEPELYGPQGAKTLLIGWGSTYGPCREAVDALNANGGSAAMLHFGQVWPLNVAAAGKAVAKRKRLVCVEGNQTGQFASMLREAGLIGKIELLSRYDGLPFTAEYIVSSLGERETKSAADSVGCSE